MGFGRTHGGYDTFTDSCQDSGFSGAAHQAFQIGSHGNSGLNQKLDTILRHRRYIGGFDYLGIYAHLYCFQNVTARQVDGSRFFKGKLDSRSFRCYQGIDHIIHISACQIVRFQLIYSQVQACLPRFDKRNDDTGRNHTPQLHSYQVENTDFNVRSHG